MHNVILLPTFINKNSCKAKAPKTNILQDENKKCVRLVQKKQILHDQNSPFKYLMVHP